MAPSFDHQKSSKNESSSGESAPLLQQTNTAGIPIQQQQQQQPYGTATVPSPYDPNNAMMTGGYFVPPPGHYPPPGTSSVFSQQLQQQQQQQHSPIIIHSAIQPSSQVIGAIPGTSGMPPQPPFLYPFPPQQQQQQQQQQNAGGPSAPYPYPPPPMGYPMQQPQQQQYQQRQYQQQLQQYQLSSSPKTSSRMGIQVGSNNNSARRTVGEASHSSSGLPSMNDIFGGSGGSESQPILGSNNPTATTSALPPLGGTSSGYGSTGVSPEVYNVPVQTRRLPPSGRSPQQFTALKGGVSSNGQKSTPSKNHRRANSDAPLRTNRAHRRNKSGDGALLPPLRGPGTGTGHNRSRTLSGGNPLLLKSRHRRGNSSNSYHSMAGDSFGAGSRDSSMMSMRSNIAKSSLFGGIDEQGRPIMYYPYEAIRLVMIPDKGKSRSNKTSLRNSNSTGSNDDDTAEQEEELPLTVGHLYSDGPANIEDYYEDYHRISDDLEQGITPQWESLDIHPILRKSAGGKSGGGGKHAACGCECTNCHACLGKQDLLPPTNYVVAISDDIYRRMFSEVADAQNLPCGLFFCGHHEDVHYPSVWIPGTLVIILFGGITYMSYCTGFVN